VFITISNTWILIKLHDANETQDCSDSTIMLQDNIKGMTHGNKQTVENIHDKKIRMHIETEIKD
jgi:ABC-type transporter Mla maintaining outer membrane lipid asymmetry ATPase subunit MlaF